MIKRVVSVGAHSLDAELMGGPLVIKYGKKGAKCTFIHITQGRLEDPKATEEDKKAYLDKLLLENKNVAETMGADAIWLGYESRNMPSTEELAKELAKYFEEEKVDLVITHFRGSWHPRHVNTHDGVLEAVKILRKKGNPIKLLYGENCEDLVGFIPQAYFKMSEDEVQTWWEALRKYSIFRGEVNDIPYYEYYNTSGAIRAMEVGLDGFVKAYMYPSLIEELW